MHKVLHQYVQPTLIVYLQYICVVYHFQWCYSQLQGVSMEQLAAAVNSLSQVVGALSERVSAGMPPFMWLYALVCPLTVQVGAADSSGGEEELVGVLGAVQRLVQELTVVLSSLDHGNATQLPQQVFCSCLNKTDAISYKHDCSKLVCWQRSLCFLKDLMNIFLMLKECWVWVVIPYLNNICIIQQAISLYSVSTVVSSEWSSVSIDICWPRGSDTRY